MPLNHLKYNRKRNSHMRKISKNLFYASGYGSVEEVAKLIEDGADVNAISTTDSLSRPLHMASMKGRSDIAMLLIQQGADVDAQNSDGESPLFYAAEYGHANVTKILIDHGANAGLLSKYSRSALYFAASRNHPECTIMLSEIGADGGYESALTYAAEHGSTECIIEIAKKGVNIDKIKQDFPDVYENAKAIIESISLKASAKEKRDNTNDMEAIGL